MFRLAKPFIRDFELQVLPVVRNLPEDELAGSASHWPPALPHLHRLAGLQVTWRSPPDETNLYSFRHKFGSCLKVKNISMELDNDSEESRTPDKYLINIQTLRIFIWSRARSIMFVNARKNYLKTK